ncbi:hypothetical protein TCA2_4590 [Paenibacillus sp. TCA20]|uniref:DUF2829 domain-containing protein n=1 Tax=Paenibacillus urinalis TaxID=521520 RepID=A0ABY7XGU4_9BACL|nr:MULTISPECIES: MW1434 family type I TA system toxin [Paenibacillus]WDI05076.1 DUF2829 domain-containing protein [Paenibacillus urinalis]GAK42098.1 hypothetical protein TCA2_4590 [Paenibacillus sp. TCA20]
MKFGHALELLEKEEKLRRDSWAPGSFIVMMPSLYLPPFSTASTFLKVNDRTAKHIGVNTPLNSQPYIAFFNGETDEWQPGWLPAQADLFASDWYATKQTPY